MISVQEIKKKIFCVASPHDFNVLSLEIFHYQYSNNPIYQRFIHELGIDPRSIARLEHIPFLPVSFFKTQSVIIRDLKPEIVFLSSATTGVQQSRHEVVDVALYESSFRRCFEQFYGDLAGYCLLALLPSYLAHRGSSLVYMADKMISISNHPMSGFYLDATDALLSAVNRLKADRQKTILLGVSYALLDMSETHPVDFPDLIVMETGGMKGRRKEMIREELHEHLSRGFGVRDIHSEYGMTELLSQAYSYGQGIYRCPPWMKTLIRDMNDPFDLIGHHRTGGINIIDLANLYSCSFIATQDLGKTYPDGSFEVLGRFDYSEMRGCNLLA